MSSYSKSRYRRRGRTWKYVNPDYRPATVAAGSQTRRPLSTKERVSKVIEWIVIGLLLLYPVSIILVMFSPFLLLWLTVGGPPWLLMKIRRAPDYGRPEFAFMTVIVGILLGTFAWWFVNRPPAIAAVAERVSTYRPWSGGSSTGGTSGGGSGDSGMRPGAGPGGSGSSSVTRPGTGSAAAGVLSPRGASSGGSAPSDGPASTPVADGQETVCADGWISPSAGQGTCSHHGGIAPREGAATSSTGAPVLVAAAPFPSPVVTQAQVAAPAGPVSSLTPRPNRDLSQTGQVRYIAQTDGIGVRLRTRCDDQSGTPGWPEGTRVTIEFTQAECPGWLYVQRNDTERSWVRQTYLATTSPVTLTPTAVPTRSMASPTTTLSPATRIVPTPASAPSITAPTSRATPTTKPQPTSGSVQQQPLGVLVAVSRPVIKNNEEQTVSVTVSRAGRPVAGAEVVIKLSPSGHELRPSPTDARGQTWVRWRPGTAQGFVGVGVSAIIADGGTGVGGASFKIE
jgi:hypothetical protein